MIYTIYHISVTYLTRTHNKKNKTDDYEYVRGYNTKQPISYQLPHKSSSLKFSGESSDGREPIHDGGATIIPSAISARKLGIFNNSSSSIKSITHRDEEDAIMSSCTWKSLDLDFEKLLLFFFAFSSSSSHPFMEAAAAAALRISAADVDKGTGYDPTDPGKFKRASLPLRAIAATS